MTLLILIFLSRSFLATGLACYTCKLEAYYGEPIEHGDCFNVNGGHVLMSSSSSSTSYCVTTFTFVDGIVTAIARNLVDDGDIPSNYCEITINRSSDTTIATSACHYHCNVSDRCNHLRVSNLKRCSTDCGRGDKQGYCDYITGTCNCASGYTGEDCSQTMTSKKPTKRKCIQCSSEIHGDCGTRLIGTECRDDENYCFTTHSSLFTRTGVLKTSVVRGCSSEFYAGHECMFSSVSENDSLDGNGYHEITCYSSCDSDLCNFKTADGVIDGDQKNILHCVQCNAQNEDCISDPSYCPAGTTNCKATVAYVISDIDDQQGSSPPSYRILSVVRECSNETTKAECNETELDYDATFKRVSCVETCQTDGCNRGWPARPKCIQCEGKATDVRDVCIYNPPEASTCEYPFDEYCYVEDHGLSKLTKGTIPGFPRIMTRGCSYKNRGVRCSTKILRGKEVQSCNYTCKTDGCNVGSRGLIHNMTSSLALFIVIITTILLC